MNSRWNRMRIWALATVVALVVGLGAGWRGAAVLGATREAENAALEAAPNANLELDETAAAFALQKQLIAVYERASTAVVNVTSRIYGLRKAPGPALCMIALGTS